MADVTLDLRLNSQSFLADLSNARSQAAMTLGGPMAAAGSGMGMAASGAATGLGQMAGGFGGSSFGMGAGFGFTHTPQDIGLNPHYGNIHAYSTTQMEAQIANHGLSAAAALAPPGVAPGEFALSVDQNRIEREVQARSNAQMAFRSSAGGIGAGLAADLVVGAGGAVVGGAIGKKFFGDAGKGVGRLVGGLAAGMFAFDIAQEMVTDHYAKVEQIGGMTQELGEIAGAGRDISRVQRYDLGVAARKAAKDLNMDVNTMGDVLAMGGAMNMMPDATDPGKARQQFAEFAKTITEGAQMLGSSLAEATQVIKRASDSGMTAREGLVRAAGMGGAAEFNRFMDFGAQGASVARSMRYEGQQGFALFTQGLGQMSGAGLSGEEMQIMGGRYGAAAFLGQTQMAVAQSPMGRMQLMAASGGQALGGMMDMPGQALSAMSSGGDMMSNLGSFMVHEDEYRRGMGAKGVKTMARQQIQMAADFMEDMMPGMNQNERRRFSAMQMYGMNATQAESYVGGLFSRGGGPNRNEQQARAAMAMQRVAVSQGITPMTAEELEKVTSESGIDWTFAKGGAAVGGLGGSIFGAGFVGGAIGTAVGGTVGAAIDAGSYVLGGDHPNLLASAEGKADFYRRRDLAEVDAEMQKRRNRYGYADTTEGDVRAFLAAKDLSGITLGAGSNTTLNARAGVVASVFGAETASDRQKIANERNYNRRPKASARKTFMQATGSYFRENENAQEQIEEYARLRELAQQAPGALHGVGNPVGIAAGEMVGAMRAKFMSDGDGFDPESDAGLVWLQQRTGRDVQPFDKSAPALQGGAAVTAVRKKNEYNRAAAIREMYTSEPRYVRINADDIDPSKASPVLQDLLERRENIRARGSSASLALTKERVDAAIERGLITQVRGPSLYKGFSTVISGDSITVREDVSEQDVARANRLFQHSAMQEAISDYRRLESAKGESEKQVLREKIQRNAQTAIVAEGASEFEGKNIFEEGSKGLLDIVKQEASGAVPQDPKPKGKGRRGVQNAIGFGAREESMDLINKSLRRTHQMLQDLNSKIKPPDASGTPKTDKPPWAP